MAENYIKISILQFICQALAYDQFVVPNRTKADLSTTYRDFYARRAVDGNKNQHINFCSHTGDETENKDAWLRIDLNRTYSIKNVKFWYRETAPGTRRLSGYSIQVSNASNVALLDSICYQDTGKPISDPVIENECQMTGLFVWIYQNNTIQDKCPILEICEIQVYGCETGKYGDSCNYTCDHCKNSDTCDIESGRCDSSGCAEMNLLPPMCNECVRGFFGSGCNDHCREFCSNKTCDRRTGTCLHGCIPGYTGDHCDQTCNFGMYGEGCNTTCGKCLYNITCHHINGTCAHGCAEGYTGTLCSTACEDGEYGRNCMYNCSENCLNNEVCDKMDGTCKGCVIGYEGQRCDSPENKINKAEVILIPAVLIVAMAIVGVVILFLYRRRKKNSLTQEMEDDHVYHLPEILEYEIVYDELSTDEEIKTFHTQISSSFNSQNTSHVSENPRTDINVSKCSAELQTNVQWSPARVIMIPDLLSRIHQLEQHSNKGFLKEFDIIHKEMYSMSCNQREHVTENRRSTNPPCDQSRSLLETPLVNKLNASFIENMNGEASYITSHGPTRETISDFWQMVWQENIRIISMTTTFLARNFQKYWPDSTACAIDQGIFLIQHKFEKKYSNYTIREFILLNKETKENREIRHLHFTAWPERGAPRPLDFLVYYRSVSRAMETYPQNKLLLHSSSGSGPTAIVIALDALYKHGLKTGIVNISDFEQYICLYHVLYEYFRGKGGVFSKDSFLTQATPQNIQNEFHILSSIKPDNADAEEPQNTHSPSEYQNMITHGAQKYFLQIGIRGVFQCSVTLLSSFTTKDCIITARYPSHGEAVDLIHLLIDQKCTTLVSVSPISEVPHSQEWFSTSVELQNSLTEVIPVAKISEHITLSTIRTKESFDQNWHQTTVYELTSWKYSESSPCDIDSMLDVIKFIQIDNCVDVDKKLVILSRDGATGCGVFCAVYNAIQQLQQDEEVDMFTIVRQLQSRRPEMISDLGEYLSCYKALRHYLERK